MASEPIPPSTEPSPVEISSTSDDRTMALLCHIGGIVTGFLVPLIIWLIKKDQSKFVDDQGKEALNFQITLVIAHAVAGLAICFHFGLVNLALWVFTIVYGILAAVAAQKGQAYRYPLTLRLIK